MKYAYILSLLSTISAICFAIYAFIGLHDNFNSKRHQLFANMCIVLTIWAFGYAVSISAETMEKALIWRRVSAIGYGSVYAVTLRYFLSNIKKFNRFTQSKLVYLIYLPAVFLVAMLATPMFGLGFQYNIEKTMWGWLHVGDSTWIDYVFYVYYLSYCGMCVFLLIFAIISADDQMQKKQGKIIMVAVCITVFVGSFTDLVLYKVFHAEPPQIASILILIPVTLILYSIDALGGIHHKEREESTRIIHSTLKQKVYNYMYVPYLIMGIVVLIIGVLRNKEYPFIRYIVAAFIILVGFIVRRVLESNIEETRKDNYICVILSSFVPVVHMYAIAFEVSTIWVYPLLILVAFLLYNSRKMIVAISISLLISILTTMLIKPTYTTVIDSYDYVFQICMYLMTIAFVLLLNHFSVVRMKEMRRQNESSKIIAKISSQLVQTNHDAFDAVIQEVVGDIGKHFASDRVNYFLIDETNDLIEHKAGWANEGVQSITSKTKSLDINMYSWGISKLSHNQAVGLKSVNDLPKEARAEEQFMKENSVKSILGVPMYDKQIIIGFIALESVVSEKEWKHNEQTNLLILGNIISDALAKYRAEKKLKEIAYYDSLTGLPKRELFKKNYKRIMAEATLNGSLVCVAMVDLDGFKTINDTLGHYVGDELIIQVAKRMKFHLDEDAIISRFGGDEFLLLFGNIADKSVIENIAKDIASAFEEPFALNENNYNITASIGLTCCTLEGNLELYINKADIAMYKAKGLGKNRYEIVD